MSVRGELVITVSRPHLGLCLLGGLATLRLVQTQPSSPPLHAGPARLKQQLPGRGPPPPTPGQGPGG